MPIATTRPGSPAPLAATMGDMDRILGQQQAIHVLQHQLSSGRMHHGFIFHGPVGVGKYTTALALARILLCHNAQTDLTGRVSACGQCESCQALASLSTDNAEPDELTDAAAADSPHPDLHIIRKELCAVSSVAAVRNRKQMNIPVDLLRELVIGGTTADEKYHDAPAHKSPILRHGKVFIIDEAELLDAPGQNALLKTLEEPPPGTTLILVTASEDRLLPTIRSRCQRVAFVPLADNTIEQWLNQHTHRLGEDDRRALITFANGSLGRARLALDYELLQWAQTVLPALDDMAGGRTHGELGGQIAAHIDEFAKAWVADRPKASKEAANKHAAQLMWSMICSHARARIAERAANCDPADPVDGEARLEPWLGVIDAVRETERLVANNVNMSLVCDHLVSQIEITLAPKIPATTP